MFAPTSYGNPPDRAIGGDLPPDGRVVTYGGKGGVVLDRPRTDARSSMGAQLVLRSILIGLDGSIDGQGALELGVSWAREHDALAVGVSVVDESGAVASDQAAFASWFRRPIAEPLAYVARKRSRAILDKFSGRCDDSQVRSKVVETPGTPEDVLLEEAEWSDLVVLGQPVASALDGPGRLDRTLDRLLRDSPRPVVVVPRSRKEGDVAIVAYDGSPQASRTLHAFEASGLALSRAVHVVSVSPSPSDAARHANRAAEFLRDHGVDAVAEPVESAGSPVDAIFGEARRHETGLIVLGAYGRPNSQEFHVGSVARAILQRSPVPVFCHH